jgi:DnaA family protein
MNERSLSPQQLALNVDFPFAATFDYFYPGDNDQLCETLQAWLANQHREWCFYLVGLPHAGRTHLLFACCHDIRAKGERCAYLSCKELIAMNNGAASELFAGLETMPFVALDDFECLVGHPDYEEQCLYLYERLKAQRGKLLVAANAVPGELNFILPDLCSRLKQSLIFQVKQLSDADKIKALQLRAQVWGWTLNETVAQFMLYHLPRDITLLFQALEELNKKSLMHQRRITIPFVKEVLNI